jgi:hypothetical protein
VILVTLQHGRSEREALDCREQSGLFDRLEDMEVGAGIEAEAHVAFQCRGGQCDDQHTMRTAVGAQEVTGGETKEIGKSRSIDAFVTLLARFVRYLLVRVGRGYIAEDMAISPGRLRFAMPETAIACFLSFGVGEQ